MPQLSFKPHSIAMRISQPRVAGGSRWARRARRARRALEPLISPNVVNDNELLSIRLSMVNL